MVYGSAVDARALHEASCLLHVLHRSHAARCMPRAALCLCAGRYDGVGQPASAQPKVDDQYKRSVRPPAQRTTENQPAQRPLLNGPNLLLVRLA